MAPVRCISGLTTRLRVNHRKKSPTEIRVAIVATLPQVTRNDIRETVEVKASTPSILLFVISVSQSWENRRSPSSARTDMEAPTTPMPSSAKATAEPRKRRVSRLVNPPPPAAPDPPDITEPFIAFISDTLDFAH